MKLIPELIHFEVGKVYYVKRTQCKEIEPLMCIKTSSERHPLAFLSKGKTKAPSKPMTEATVAHASELEYVLAGVPEEVLHEAYRRHIWGKNEQKQEQPQRQQKTTVAKRVLV